MASKQRALGNMARSLYGPTPGRGPLTISEVYVGMMEEIKLRVKGLHQYYRGEATMAHGQIAREFCFLQLRMICEIMAIGCLLIHKHHSDVKQFEKLWHAGDVMDRLERLNPNFFPKAVTITRLPDTNFDCKDVTPAPLTKKQFLTMYGKCGAQLHRGTIKEIATGIPASSIDLTDAHEMSNKIIELLRVHRIASADNKNHFFCRMENGPPGSGVAMLTAKN
jgi:hypothetical protein